MKINRFVFVGNRFFVLEDMLKQGIEVKKIFAVKDSYLEKELLVRDIPFERLETKIQLIDYIKNNDFDIFLANGCPYIIPVSKIRKNNLNKRFINIHPSFLPDLKGADPQPAALLFGRDSGATCHEMDDGIDTGSVISQVKIDYSIDIDISLLYQMTFLAEKKVFKLALDRNFRISEDQIPLEDSIYYTFDKSDLLIDFTKSAMDVYRQIKAFNNKSKGACFTYADKMIKVFDVEIVENEFLSDMYKDNSENEIVLIYEDILLVKKRKSFLKLKNFNQDISMICKGDVL